MKLVNNISSLVPKSSRQSVKCSEKMSPFSEYSTLKALRFKYFDIAQKYVDDHVSFKSETKEIRLASDLFKDQNDLCFFYCKRA